MVSCRAWALQSVGPLHRCGPRGPLWSVTVKLRFCFLASVAGPKKAGAVLCPHWCLRKRFRKEGQGLTVRGGGGAPQG